MNQEVPQPTTATRSPGAGRSVATRADSSAAARQQAGCDAISASVRAPGRLACSVTLYLLHQFSHQVPARPVEATDLTKYRCATTNMSNIGARLITFPAMRSVHSVEWAPWKFARPRGSVIWFVEVTAMSGQRKLFQESRNVSAARVARAGPDSGSTTRNSTVSRLAPSTLAASSYSI